MELQELQTFVRTAELLHFGRASRACNLSPSALTRTIQRLEQEVGQPLFLRDNRSVSLTETGSRLLAYARSALQDWQRFQDSLSAGTRLSGSLSLYASITAVYSLLPELLERFRSAHPEVQLELRTGAAERAIERVLSGEIDLAVAAVPDQSQSRLEFLPLAETPLVFIAPRTPRFTPLKRFSGAEPLVVPRSGTARKRLDAWFRSKGITPDIASEVSGNEALIAMVRLGTGIGVVPRLVLERSPFRGDVVLLKSAPRLAPYVVGLCATRRHLRHPSVRAMWDLASAL